MPKYIIRDIQETDYKRVTEIYNSNPQFLLNHLGMTSIDESFISKEVSEMNKVGFNSCVIVEKNSQLIQGVLDYKSDKEVYLSLLMLSADLQGQGIGRNIYSSFESNMIQAGNISIRIDVVNDYPENLVPFWEGLGFSVNECVTLNWGNKKSNAVVMRKQPMRTDCDEA